MTKVKKAVALRYPAGAQAPFINASGKDFSAEKILKIAEENHIPVVKNENLTNVLSLFSVGQIIPEELYEAVAKVFAAIQTIEEKT